MSLSLFAAILILLFFLSVPFIVRAGVEFLDRRDKAAQDTKAKWPEER